MLGPFEVHAGDRPLPLTAAKQKTILALLVLQRGEVVSIDRLKEALWAERPPASASTALHGYVSQLRRLLESGENGGGSSLLTRSPGYVLDVAPEQVDIGRFERLAGTGRDALARGEVRQASSLLAEALALWRGAPLADFAYDAWAAGEIARLEELRLAAVEDRIEADLAVGRHAELVGELEMLAGEHPLRERLRGQLMLAFYRAGRQAEALEAYQAARSALVDELGIEPRRELQELNRLILTQDASLAAPRSAGAPRPVGTVTFLATDIEGSTRTLRRLGNERYAAVLEQHRRLLRAAVEAAGGVELDEQGDSFLFAFSTASEAAKAALAAQQALETAPWPADGRVLVRMGLHSGEPQLSGDRYIGLDVHRVARISAAAHGGQILASAAARRLAGDAARWLDLGEHRLKDLGAPERLFQLGDGHHPPLATLHQAQLPVHATSFVGRESELDDLTALLSSPDVRLLTITGPGGIGKTRVAVELARRFTDRYPDGVWFVDLSALRDPALVLPTVRQKLGVEESPAAAVADRRALLILDNFEHVLEAAPGIGSLLASGTGLDVLATSREPLHLSSEQRYALAPLAEPAAADLFADRARAIQPEFTAAAEVEEICRRLDGLPLAIELAAARVGLLSPAQMLSRLDRRLPLLAAGARDQPERQRTLQTTIDWSYELLSEAEMRLFERLSVFAGGCTLEAAEQVCDAELDTLHALVDKSLVRAGNERFVMLEAIREYAYGRLEEHGEADELGRRHFDYFLRVAADAEPRPVSPVHTLRLEGLETEHDNLRIALGRVRAAGDPESVLRLAGALVYFWFVHGHVDEGRRWIEEGLALGHELPADVRAKALHGASFFALLQGDAERAAESAEESLGIWRELDDATGTARALNELAMALQAQGDYEAAGARYAEARELHRGSDHEFGAIVLTLNLASLAHEQGDHGRAQQLFEEALDEAGAHGFHVPRITAQIGRALVSFDLGRTERARADLVEALAACRESGFVDGACDCLDGLAAILTASGETPHAVRLVGAAQELRRPRRVVPDKVIARLERRVLAESSDRLGETAVSALLEEGRALTLDDAVGLVAAVV